MEIRGWLDHHSLTRKMAPCRVFKLNNVENLRVVDFVFSVLIRFAEPERLIIIATLIGPERLEGSGYRIVLLTFSLCVPLSNRCRI